MRQSFELALRIKSFDKAIELFQLATDLNGGQNIDMDFAIRIVMDYPIVEIVAPTLRHLAAEVDTGHRDWTPRIASLRPSLVGRDNIQRAMFLAFLPELSADKMDPATLIVWETLVGRPLSDAALLRVFEDWLPSARLLLVATAFSTQACEIDPTRKDRAAEIARYVEEKLSDANWLPPGGSAGFVAYLIFATVFSLPAYRALIAVGRQRVCSLRVGHGPADSETVLATLLKTAAVPDVPLPAASIIGASRDKLCVTVTITGQLRGYEKARGTWRYLGLDQHDVTTLVSTWKDTGRNWARCCSFVENYKKIQRSCDESERSFLHCCDLSAPGASFVARHDHYRRGRRQKFNGIL